MVWRAMREKPNLSDEKNLQSLQDGFAIPAKQVEFLPLGNDSNAWAYRVEAERQLYFLKVKRDLSNPHGITIPYHLHHLGMTQVVAPIPTQTGALWHSAGEYTLLLYPFIEGDNGMKPA